MQCSKRAGGAELQIDGRLDGLGRYKSPNVRIRICSTKVLLGTFQLLYLSGVAATQISNILVPHNVTYQRRFFLVRYPHTCSG
jgi:hypothetical protein